MEKAGNMHIVKNPLNQQTIGKLSADIHWVKILTLSLLPGLILAIIHLSFKVGAFNTNVTNLNSNVSNLDKNVANLNNHFIKLDKNFTEIDTNFTHLSETVKTLSESYKRMPASDVDCSTENKRRE